MLVNVAYVGVSRECSAGYRGGRIPVLMPTADSPWNSDVHAA